TALSRRCRELSGTCPARLAGPTSVCQSAPGELNPVSHAPRARGLPSSSTPIQTHQFGEEGSNLHLLGQSQVAYRLADPRVFCPSDTPSRSQVGGEGVEPSRRQLQRLLAYRLADPRECPAGVEPAFPLWESGAWPPGPGHANKLRGWESNPRPSG